MKSLFFAISSLALAAGHSAGAQGLDAMQLGTSMPLNPSERTIVIGPDTKSVNVTENQVVKFVIGATEFTWRFDGAGSRSFDLQQIAPAGTLQQPVKAYVNRLPAFR